MWRQGRWAAVLCLALMAKAVTGQGGEDMKEAEPVAQPPMATAASAAASAAASGASERVVGRPVERRMSEEDGGLDPIFVFNATYVEVNDTEPVGGWWPQWSRPYFKCGIGTVYKASRKECQQEAVDGGYLFYQFRPDDVNIGTCAVSNACKGGGAVAPWIVYSKEPQQRTEL
eukprot:CAMPEP_0180674714 /NCGR_PEP_ID=MMETSP1037_2-20121125/66382_1 /TAXON_ID=632150 /ORGANISM="Azadinium spinosum, Strain 3D9" /LENGTH=172 /DNA_ID=CAMNT_0022704081 /DNA_START=87 /DNA_END=606 /DNA_ORIENTATION=-